MKGADQYYLHLFPKKQPDLNWENSECAKVHYIKWSIGGLRRESMAFGLMRSRILHKSDSLPDMPNPYWHQYVPAYKMHTNQDGILDYLQELKEETFSKYDIMTVGEANGVKIEQRKNGSGNRMGSSI